MRSSLGVPAGREADVMFDVHETDSLNNRFKPINGLQYDGIFSVDDDALCWVEYFLQERTCVISARSARPSGANGLRCLGCFMQCAGDLHL